MTVINAFTVDVEDWYHAITSIQARRDRWNGFEPRVVNNTQSVLNLLAEYGVQGTFFVLGHVVERFPELVKTISQAGHEIGVHGYWHNRIHQLSREQFAAEIDLTLRLLQPLITEPIRGHRAPYFSINARSLWALEVLSDFDFQYDSSFFATSNTLYGYPGSPRFPHRIEPLGLTEFPLSTARWAGITWPIAGGLYMRALPYAIIQAGIRQLNRQGVPAILYLHPWELDVEHRYRRVRPREYIVQYTGRAGLEKKLRRLFADFQFQPLRELPEPGGA